MRDFWIKGLYSLGLVLLICGLMLIPSGSLIADDGLGQGGTLPAGCSGTPCSNGCESVTCRVNSAGDTCTPNGFGGNCGCGTVIPGSDCTGCTCKVHTDPFGVTSCKCKGA